MRKTKLALATCLLAVVGNGAERTVMLSAAQDVGISSVRGHMLQSNGGAPTTPLRQDQNWSGFQNKTLLLGFDTAAIRGWRIRGAWLHLCVARGDIHAVGVCDVLAPWQSGAALNFLQETGAACWSYARTPRDPLLPEPGDYWAWPGSGLYSVAWAHPAARYSHAGPGVLERGEIRVAVGMDTNDSTRTFRHLRVPIDPDQVAALSAGTSHGLIVTDDKGQVTESYALVGPGTPYRDNDAEDPWVFTSKVQVPELRPRLEVVGEPAPATPPAAIADLKLADVNASEGTVTLAFTAPADAAGGRLLAYEVSAVPAGSAAPGAALPRWETPLPAAPGQTQRLPVWTLAPGAWRLRVIGIDRAGNRQASGFLDVNLPPPPKRDLECMPPAPYVSVPDHWRRSVYAVSDLEKIDPVTGGALAADGTYRPVSDAVAVNAAGSDGTLRLLAAANEVVAWQVIVARGSEPVRKVKVSVGDLTGRGGKTLPAGQVRCFRVWYVKDKAKVKSRDAEMPAAWYGDACVPLAPPFEETFDVPTADNGISNQSNQSVWFDLHVPQGTPAGAYDGRIVVTAEGVEQAITLPLQVTVLPFELPDVPTFPVELNCYGGLASFCGVSGDAARMAEAEWRCYALAKQHRLNLNALPYGQRGIVDASRCPVLAGDGAETRVADWSPFDTRLGPLLDGSAFTPARGYAGPGAGTPISHLYLPLHENWPLALTNWYGDYAAVSNRLQYAEWAKKSRRLDEAFPVAYREGYAGVARQIAEHFQAKGWTNTVFEFFLNNKYYYKAAFFGEAGGKAGSSFWLLDESIDYDDYAANRFFMQLAKRGFAAFPGVRFVTRVDVSQPEMTRGLFDNVCDLWICGVGSIRDRYVTTAAVRRRWLPSESSWYYGGGPAIAAPSGQMLPVLLSAWAAGAKGALPYWTVLHGRDWRKADDLAVYYTGKGYAGGGRDYPGPLPGLRMKVLRRSQQDIEYLNLLAAEDGWNLPAVRRAIAPYADDPAAPVLLFDKLTAARQDELRRSVAATLAAQ
jgi:hypothetical protein